MSRRLTVSVSMLLCFVVCAATASAQDDGESWYRPFAFLMGKTWKAPLPGGGAAEGKWEWMYEGHFIHAKGWTKDADGKVTARNETVMTWDSENKRPTFWFYLSDGSYSVGHMELTGEAEGKTFWDISGRHLQPDDVAYEWRGKWEIDPAQGTVTIHQLVPDGEGGYKIGGTLNYSVID